MAQLSPLLLDEEEQPSGDTSALQWEHRGSSELVCYLPKSRRQQSPVGSVSAQARSTGTINFVYTERPPPTTRLFFEQPQELGCVFIALQGGRAPEREIHVLLLKFRRFILLLLPWKRRSMYVDPAAPQLLKQEMVGDDG